MDPLKHFVRLARRGHHKGASHGEQLCHKIAAAVVEAAGHLDGDAVEGLIEFVRGANNAPWLAEEMLAPGGNVTT